MRKIEVVTHYFEDDPNFYGDYAFITIEEDGKVVKTFGDYYHDKGKEKAEGFIAGLEYSGVEFDITYKKIADNEY